MSPASGPNSYLDKKLMRVLEWAPTWSALRSLGRSRVVSLTAAAPFLGSLILFNEQVIELVKLGSSALQIPPDQASHFSLTRLKLTYMGLVALGIASFAFLISCPSAIKLHASIQEYIEKERLSMTGARRRLLLYEIVRDYFSSTQPTELPHLRTGTPIYPSSVYQLFHSFIDQVMREIDPDMIFEDLDGNRARELNGEVDTNVTAWMLYIATPPYRDLSRALERASASIDADILSLKFGADDHSRPFMRSLVAYCFGMGFFALSIPTVQTFYLIAGPPARALFGIGP